MALFVHPFHENNQLIDINAKYSPEIQEKNMLIKKQIKFVIALLLILLPTTAVAADVTLRWQANQEADISGYNVYYGTASRSYGQPIPVGNVTSYTVENLTAGSTYYFSVTAVDTSGNESGYSTELTAITTSSEPTTNNPSTSSSTSVPAKSVSLSAAERSPQPVGKAIHFTASATGGGNYEYRFYIETPANSGNITLARDYSTSPSYTWNTSSVSASTSNVGVAVRQVGSTAEYEKYDYFSYRLTAPVSTTTTPTVSTAPTALTMTLSASSPVTAGDVVEITAQPTGGSNLEYRFLIGHGSKGNRKWTEVQAYSPDNSYTWNTAGHSGSYLLQAYVRNVGSTATYQRYARIGSFVVSTALSTPTTPLSTVVPPSALSIRTDTPSPVNAGTVVEITAQPVGGSNLEYLFMIGQGSKNKRKWEVVQDYSSDNTFTWNTAGHSGSYLLQAYVRNVGSTATYQRYARISSFVVNSN